MPMTISITPSIGSALTDTLLLIITLPTCLSTWRGNNYTTQIELAKQSMVWSNGSNGRLTIKHGYVNIGGQYLVRA